MLCRKSLFSLVAIILSRDTTFAYFWTFQTRPAPVFCIYCFFYLCAEWHMAVHTEELHVQNKSKRQTACMNNPTACSICPLFSSETVWAIFKTLGFLLNGYWQFVRMVLRHWTILPPCPYMVKTLKYILLQNQESFEAESWNLNLSVITDNDQS